MKASVEFYNKIAVHHDAIKQICKNEMTAMKDAFCKHEYVDLHSRRQPGDETYFEYRVVGGLFVDAGYGGAQVLAVRYYVVEDEWTVVLMNHDGTAIMDEFTIDQLNIAELIEFVALLKRELFDY